MISLKMILFVVGVLAVMLGFILVRFPKKSIDAQIYFYSLINWRMEPIDLKREIHSTVWMGWTALICGVGTLWLCIK